MFVWQPHVKLVDQDYERRASVAIYQPPRLIYLTLSPHFALVPFMPFRDRLRRLHGRFIEFLESLFPTDDHPAALAPESSEDPGTTFPPVVPPDNDQTGTTSAPQPNADSLRQQLARSPSANRPAAAADPEEGETESWTRLRSFLRALDRSPLAFGPLKVVTSGLVDCVEIFEKEANNRKEYNKLRTELENVFETLEQLLTQVDSLVVTASMESLCASIQKELGYVQKKQERGTGERQMEARNDLDDVLMIYQRIHVHFQRLSLNVNVSMWKIVDEQATGARLNSLRPSLAACYNSAQALEVKRGSCTPGTRVDVLGQMHSWIHNPTTGIVYWLNGMAGTGKTTISYTLCDELEAAYQLGASFFCSRSLPDCRDVNLIIPSIAYQLAQFSRPFRSALSQVLEKEPNVHTRLLRIQFESLIVKPLMAVQKTLPEDLVVVIDALDECNNQQSTGLILDALFTKASDLPIKFFISSRPEPEIRDQMRRQGDHQAASRLILHELDKGTVQGDIETYLRQALAPIHPTDSQINTLVQRAGILFIYAATVVRYISHSNFRRNPRGRLERILNLTVASGSNPYKDIDELYTVILQAAMGDPDLSDTERDDIKQVLYTTVCAREPLTISALSGLLGLHDIERVNMALQPLWSVLHVVETSGLVATLHASFPDYMFDPKRSGDYHCDSITCNESLARCCFDCIKSAKRQFNICELKSSYVLDEKIPDDLNAGIQRAVFPELFYACRYWASHLDHAEVSTEMVERLQAFLSTRLLLWMEVMNLKKCMDEGTRAMQQAEGWCIRRGCSEELVQLVHDAWRFVAAFTSSVVSQSTPHIYVSMLPFWPESTPIARCYGKGMKFPPVPQGPAIARRRLDLLATWPVDGEVTGLAWSPDSARLALIAGGDILLLDGITGRVVVGPLKKPHPAQSIAYSCDGTRIVSGSKDGTIRVWDAESGKKVAGPLKGHKKEVTSVAFSPDGARIVSGSNDKTLRIWDIESEKAVLKPLIGHSGSVTSLKVSPNGNLIISGSDDTTICVWDARSGQAVLSPLKGHTGSVNSVALSPDGTRIASGSDDRTIRMWDIRSGKQVLGSFEGHTDGVKSVGFSPGGARIVSGSTDRTIRAWDTQTGQMVLGPLKGHTSGVGLVAFSPDGTRIVSGSDDKTIRVWDIQSGSTTLDPIESHSAAVDSVGFSPDGTRIVSGSRDNTIRVWDIQSGKTVLGPLEGHTDDVHSVAFSPDGTRIVSGSGDSAIRVWEIQSGQMVLGPLEGHTKRVWTVAFSPDSSRVVSGSADCTILVWDLLSGQTVLGPLKGGIGGIISVNFSPDGTRIVSGSDDRTIRVWDVQTGQTVLDPFEGHTARVWSVGFSPDGSRIVSGSADHTVRVWDIRSGKTVLGPLKGHTNEINSVGFSPDGTRIVSGSDDNTILIWDAQSGQPVLGPLKGHTGWVRSVGFSPDGARIVSGSYDKTIRVWDVRSPQTPSSPSALPIHVAWEIDSSGWVTDDQSRLLVWIPPDLRDALLPPRVIFRPLPNAFVFLNFENVRIGESWAECYQPV